MADHDIELFILAFLKDNPRGVRFRALAEALPQSPETVRFYMNRLLADGRIVRVGWAMNTRYLLPEDLLQQPPRSQRDLLGGTAIHILLSLVIARADFPSRSATSFGELACALYGPGGRKGKHASLLKRLEKLVKLGFLIHEGDRWTPTPEGEEACFRLTENAPNEL